MLHLNQTLLAPRALLTLNLLLPRSECLLPSPGQPRPPRALGLSPPALWMFSAAVRLFPGSFVHSFIH